MVYYGEDYTAKMNKRRRNKYIMLGCIFAVVALIIILAWIELQPHPIPAGFVVIKNY